MLTADPDTAEPAEANIDIRHAEALLKTGALQKAIFNSANFSSIATDAKGVIQIFNVGAERMLGYPAAEVVNKITPAPRAKSRIFSTATSSASTPTWSSPRSFTRSSKP